MKEEELTNSIKDLFLRLSALSSEYNSILPGALEILSRKKKEKILEINTHYDNQVAAAKANIDEVINKMLFYVRNVVESNKFGFLEWENSEWNSWNPDNKFLSDSEMARFVRLGALQGMRRMPADKEQGQNITNSIPSEDIISVISQPAFHPIFGWKSLLFYISNPKLKEAAAKGIQAFLLRLLTNIPPGKLRFTFIDPIGRGQNFTPFLHLADYDDDLITKKVWTEREFIEKRLADITEHMENVIQKYMRNEYETIEEYNLQAGDIAEPFRVLVVMDFPNNFNEESVRRLLSIVENGPRCGIYTIILCDKSVPMPYGTTIDSFTRISSVIAWEGDKFYWNDKVYEHFWLELDNPPSSKEFSQIVKKVGQAAKAASVVKIPFESVVMKSGHINVEEWWKHSTQNEIHVPLGQSGANKIQYLTLGHGELQHVLIAGMTGIGKTNLLHVIITGLSLFYSPAEVELYLIDFKQGVEFKIYATEPYRLPHAKVIAIESEREFGLSVLEGVEKEYLRRGDLFTSATERYGYSIQDISEYRKATGECLPRLVVIIDEFQVLFSEDDTIHSSAAALLDNLIRLGRAFGIHIILSSQTLAGYSLPRSTVDQMAIRVALQCSEADSRLILSDDNPSARLLSRPGEAIYNSSNGRVEGNNLFQVAYLDKESGLRNSYLKQIYELARRNGIDTKQVVFEGNAPAILNNNQALWSQLMSANNGMASQSSKVWLGEPVAIKAPTSVTFEQKSGHNFLIVCKNDEMKSGLLASVLMSLSTSMPVDEPNIFFLDFGAGDAALSEISEYVKTHLSTNIWMGRRRDIEKIIDLHAIVMERRMSDDGDKKFSSVFFIINDPQLCRDLRLGVNSAVYSDNSDDATAPKPLTEMLYEIIQDGPSYGVHTIIGFDTYNNFNRVFELDALKEFVFRAAGQMGADDSQELLDITKATKLGRYFAYLFNEDTVSTEKFRPYSLPKLEWLIKIKSSRTS